MNQSCMKCHGYQGYTDGDLRGGVGVSVSMQPYLDAEQKELQTQWITYVLIWLTGLAALGYFYVRAKISAHRLQVIQQQFAQNQKTEAVSTLVTGLGRDFNDILASMTSNLYLLKSNLKENLEAEQKLLSIETLTYRAGALINSLLAFASRESGDMQPMLFSSLVNDTVKIIRPSLPENIRINQEICSEPLQIRGSAIHLKQAVQNLINNAQEAVEGVSDPKVAIRLESFFADGAFIHSHAVNRSGNYAHLVIEDNGRGVPEHQIAHLFEPFFTTKREGKGAGLGLAVVYGTINAHGGFVEVESVEGEGSSFHIYLPLLEGKGDVSAPKAGEDE
ncbi:Histidine kinase-, DNA gyrase B-, and HSP90-like ATPase [Mariprofundus aestuarium]|uniref:histidine kinase n=2 Tax=Mariprofundus aestuarium TaxID=1921086 RepID=A0A2K8KYT3_MARES|nr:Histidine kinase-, DNA gyrase B-, and HSP90-like ATPase [Mariprofundus aestuarium]